MSIPSKRNEDRESVPPVIRDLLNKLIDRNLPFHVRENHCTTVEKIIRVCQYDLDRFNAERSDRYSAQRKGR